MSEELLCEAQVFREAVEPRGGGAAQIVDDDAGVDACFLSDFGPRPVDEVGFGVLRAEGHNDWL